MYLLAQIRIPCMEVDAIATANVLQHHMFLRKKTPTPYWNTKLFPINVQILTCLFIHVQINCGQHKTKQRVLIVGMGNKKIFILINYMVL